MSVVSTIYDFNHAIFTRKFASIFTKVNCDRLINLFNTIQYCAYSNWVYPG